ncbi:hypothetical protein COLO4_35565 [Corchorus olitorius]|uniref:Uncharacterized protein n=1 Tax=Corchorus olitorius TaxID=93759 RepID=A0A1R3GFD9_9ROSI|nr:hypothetical protein COLO4_35565 [Corchorus olitorius]
MGQQDGCGGGDRDHGEESNSCEKEKKEKKANPWLGGVAMLWSQICNAVVELSHDSENESAGNIKEGSNSEKYKEHGRFKRAPKVINDYDLKLDKVRAKLKEYVNISRVGLVGSHEAVKGKSNNGKVGCSRKKARMNSRSTSRRRGTSKHDSEIEHLVTQFVQMKPKSEEVMDMVAKICREECKAHEPSMPRCGVANIKSKISHFRTRDRVMSRLENCEQVLKHFMLCLQIFIPINDQGVHWAGDPDFSNFTEWDHVFPALVPQEQNS